MYNMQSTTF